METKGFILTVVPPASGLTMSQAGPPASAPVEFTTLATRAASCPPGQRQAPADRLPTGLVTPPAARALALCVPSLEPAPAHHNAVRACGAATERDDERRELPILSLAPTSTARCRQTA